MAQVHDDWLRNILGLDPAAAQMSSESGKQGNSPAVPAEGTHRGAIDAAVDKRRAQRDAEIDEYGIAKPAVSWTEKLTDAVAPAEVINDKDTAWYETIGRTLLVAPAAIAGHTLDAIAPVNTRGEFKLPFPILGEMAEGDEQGRYMREREEHEERLKQGAEHPTASPDETQAGRPGPWADDADAPKQCDPTLDAPNPQACGPALPEPVDPAARPPGPWADDDATAAEPTAERAPELMSAD